MYGRVESTIIMFFMHKSDVPQETMKDIICAKIVCDKKNKSGENLINFPDHCRMPTADLLSIKLLLNIVIS